MRLGRSSDKPFAGGERGRSPRPGARAPTTYLHIGTMKTGTSFVQDVLLRNRSQLATAGVLYPLDGKKWSLQVRGARDVLGIRGEPADGGWDALVDTIHAWNGPSAVVSMEFFSLASTDGAQRVVDGLAPSQVEVILTARDLVRVLPSAWQTMIKQGRTWSFPEFLTAVTQTSQSQPGSTRSGAGQPSTADSDAYRRFWRHNNLVPIARRWAAAVGPEHVHLVTVPPSGSPPSLLWERISSVLGLDPGEYDISQGQQSNFSLSYSDTELLRQINLSLPGDLSDGAYRKWSTRFLANEVMRASASDETADDRPTLDAAAHQWAIERSHQMVKKLSSLGVDVVGDLDDLIPAERAAGGDTGAATPRHPYPQRAAMLMAALLARLAVLDETSGGAASAPSESADDFDPDDDPAIA